MNSLLLGFYELVAALGFHPSWLFLGFQEIRLRYRRSVLGPIWLTLSTAIFILTLSFLWSSILSSDLKTYVPYFAIGQIIWVWISTSVAESCVGFSLYEGMIKQVKLPFPIYILRICTKNFIILLHNFVVILIIIVLIFPSVEFFSFLLVIPALLIIQTCIFSVSLFLGIVCTRYRDITQIVTSLMQLMFFFTPIMWFVKSLGSRQWIAEFNPLYHLISIIRLPLLGQFPTLLNWVWAISTTILLLVIALRYLGKYTKKIAYWL
ncbi:ABC transporter permease [Polynucleobacter paneuropaeus]|uniref:ABC transporter permease n=1 Tax=Polynucleobacter paneuropaeus TaxID=2527775 RepID=A0A2Z4JQU9_9BURK|nr:ABC transporter permease [Polynucleobacter paneuropaeus]